MFYQKELDFFKSFMTGCKINVNIITPDNTPADIDFGIRETAGLSDDYAKFFDISTIKNNTIHVVQDMFECKYIFIPLPEQEKKTVLVAGPYITKLISRQEIEKASITYSLSASSVSNIQKYFNVVPFISDDGYVTAAVNCLCETLYGSSDNFKFITKQKEENVDISFLIADKRNIDSDSPLLTIQMIEKAYEQENGLLEAISKGNVHKAESFFTSGKPSDILETRVTDRLRNAKNFLIILNTLARKAVEQGGVHPLYIDSVSSDFALRIEACQSTDECDDLFFKIIRQYSRLVQKHSQKDYSLLVQKVITCIDTDITGDLSLKTQAKLLNVNSSYLSTLFKKETGMNLTEYVNAKRIERAKNLLKTGNMQIQTVAQSCGILDVNYFTKIFKKHTGLTPKEFKGKNQNIY